MLRAQLQKHRQQREQFCTRQQLITTYQHLLYNVGVDFFMAKTAQEIRLNSREDLWAFKDILLIQKNRAVFLIKMCFFGISKIIIILFQEKTRHYEVDGLPFGYISV